MKALKLNVNSAFKKFHLSCYSEDMKYPVSKEIGPLNFRRASVTLVPTIVDARINMKTFLERLQKLFTLSLHLCSWRWRTDFFLVFLSSFFFYVKNSHKNLNSGHDVSLSPRLTTFLYHWEMVQVANKKKTKRKRNWRMEKLPRYVRQTLVRITGKQKCC